MGFPGTNCEHQILQSDTPAHLKAVELIVLRDLIQKAFTTVD